MVGYAIYSAVYGEENVYRFGIVDLGQVIFVFFVMVTLLERQSSGARPFRETLLNFVKTPVIVAILAGIVFNQLGLQEAFSAWAPATSVLDALSLLGGMTTPLVIIVIGYELRLPALSLASTCSEATPPRSATAPASSSSGARSGQFYTM